MSAFFATIAHFIPVAWNAVVTYAPAAIAVAAAGAAALPKGTPGTTWYVARQVLDVIALNFGNAKKCARNAAARNASGRLMIALLLAALPFIIQAAPVISAVAGVAGLIADLEAISASPETKIVLTDIEALFKKHGVKPEQLAAAIKGLSWGGQVTKEWVADPRHRLDKDGNFM